MRDVMASLSAVGGGGVRGWWGLLLKRGADQDVGDQEGKKPLYIVAQLGRAELAELLIRYGAGQKPAIITDERLSTPPQPGGMIEVHLQHGGEMCGGVNTPEA